MSRTRTVFRCQQCGATEPKWTGRCSGCDAWSTLVEERVEPVAGTPLGPVAGTPRPIAEVAPDEIATHATGVGELDRVLQGGLAPSSVTLLGGEPGIGKSTLLLQALAGLALTGRRCLYLTAEESAPQVRRRAERLGALPAELWLAAETSMPHVLAHLDQLGPDVLALDSIQTVHDPTLGSAPGSVVQVRESAHRLVEAAKSSGTAVVLVGHVTKDGGLAGPRVLEHVVDTVLSFEGERHHALRLLRAVKHRFGATDELGLFEMTAHGLEGVPDPSALFLADRRPGTAGSVVAAVLDGHRPLLVEVQALVAPTKLPMPRRSAQGLDSGRMALVLAVLQQRVRSSFAGHDVHTVAAGGVTVHEPGADLAIALALASAHSDEPLPDDLVACGEVGLGGELRQVQQTPRRLAEAARLGFRRAIVPASVPSQRPGIELLRATTLAEAVRLAGVRAGGDARVVSLERQRHPAGRAPVRLATRQ